jgi:CelD/BcsL family acetyltransferase involved in cellulose biosynthesis
VERLPVAAPAEIPEGRRADGPGRGPPRDGPRFSVVTVSDAKELEAHIPAWEDLAATAIEPNVFYEAWMLLPALRAYGGGRPLTVVLVYAEGLPQARGRPLLCGLYPLERQRRLQGRCVVLRSWQYAHCYLGVPLVRAGFGHECLRALFAWLAADRHGAALLSCAGITADGAFYPLLLEALQAQGRTSFVAESYARALLRPGGGEEYLRAVLSGDKRKKLRRAEERLAEAGPVRYATLPGEADLELWLAEFLRLEASGWKGREGTALASRPADRDFFLAVARAAFRRGRLRMLALYAGERLIAQQCDFLAGDGAFAFKVAFDEAYARYSPGVLLEVENVRRIHARPEIRWMDSCTVGGASLVKQLWADRRVIQDVLVETGRAPGALVLAALPLLRWLRGFFG